ncbi:hypothetical protein CYY_009619 [Polysphondylium violaceum]|uniref:peptidylprolyl isomerase n=1 Tax=Polysphondylium violaceum TaxID=133409 RepID=A0A8J4PLD9_9MYCE|nr:hypothetical protein CYY_009619 [Polysphondylium violaceum]
MEISMDHHQAILIPYDVNKPFQTITVSKKDTSIDVLKYLDSKEFLIEYISKQDVSYIYFPKVEKYTDDMEVLRNERASLLVRRTGSKVFCGNAIFIRSTVPRKEGVHSAHPVDITVEQFQRVYQYITNPPIVHAFDFEGNLESYSDLVDVILNPSTFNFPDGDIWIEKKNQNAILNEYYSRCIGLTTAEPLYEAFGQGGPFVSFFKVDKELTIYSSVQSTKSKARMVLSHRLLRYYIYRQQNLFFGTEFTFDNGYQEYIESKEKDAQERIEYQQKKAEQLKQQQLEGGVPDGPDIKMVDTPTVTQELKEEDIEIYDLLNNSKIIKKVTTKTSSTACPSFGDQVSMSFRLYCENKMIGEDSGKILFVIGESNNIVGLHIALMNMSPGEKASVLIHPDFAYGDLGIPNLIPPQTPVRVEVHMMSIDSRCNPSKLKLHLMTTQQKIEAAKKIRTMTKNFFSANQIGKCIKLYRSAVNYVELENLGKFETQELFDQWKDEAIAIFINLAICYSRIQRWDRVYLYAKKAGICGDEDNPKVHFWFSRCAEVKNDYENAIVEMLNSQNADYNNTYMKPEQYQTRLSHLKKLLNKQTQAEKNMYKKIFENFVEDVDVNQDEILQEESKDIEMDTLND